MNPVGKPPFCKFSTALSLAFFAVLLGNSFAQPVLDASTPDTFTETSAAVVEAAKNSGEIGLVDVARLEMALNGVLLGAMSYALEKGGANLAPSDAKRLAAEKLRPYNGMTGAQFLQTLQDAAVAQGGAGNLAAKQRASKTQAILQAWLKGDKVPLGDGNSLIEYDVRGKERGNQTDIVDVYVTREGEKGRLFRGYLDETGENLLKIQPAEFFPFCRFEDDTPPSLDRALFWIPKYKEWIKTMLGHSATERLPAFVKRLPSPADETGVYVSPMWLLFNGSYDNPLFYLLYVDLVRNANYEEASNKAVKLVSDKEAELIERLKVGTLQEFLDVFHDLEALSPTEVKGFEDILLAFNEGKIQSQQRRLQAEASSKATEEALQEGRKAVDEALK